MEKIKQKAFYSSFLKLIVGPVCVHMIKKYIVYIRKINTDKLQICPFNDETHYSRDQNSWVAI